MAVTVLPATTVLTAAMARPSALRVAISVMAIGSVKTAGMAPAVVMAGGGGGGGGGGQGGFWVNDGSGNGGGGGGGGCGGTEALVVTRAVVALASLSTTLPALKSSITRSPAAVMVAMVAMVVVWQ